MLYRRGDDKGLCLSDISRLGDPAQYYRRRAQDSRLEFLAPTGQIGKAVSLTIHMCFMLSYPTVNQFQPVLTSERQCQKVLGEDMKASRQAAFNQLASKLSRHADFPKTLTIAASDFVSYGVSQRSIFDFIHPRQRYMQTSGTDVDWKKKKKHYILFKYNSGDY